MNIFHHLAVFCTAAAVFSSAAQSQTYPSKPIRIVVPYSAGGASDGPMRVIAQEMSKQLGQQVSVDNKPGMGAMLGAEIVARAAPDGYTLLLGSNPEVISPSLYSNLSFDPVEDFTPIGLFSREPSVLVVHPALPVQSIKEFIAYIKAHPSNIDFASSGNGSAQHLFTEMLLSKASLKMVHVPYKGSGQATTDLIAGQVKVAMPGLAAMMVHIKDNRLRPLAVSGAERSPLLPDVPTLEESGFPGFTAYVWNGLMAPKHTPALVIDRLSKELKAALMSASVQAFMKQASIESLNTSPAEFMNFLREERERNAKIIKETGLKID